MYNDKRVRRLRQERDELVRAANAILDRAEKENGGKLTEADEKEYAEIEGHLEDNKKTLKRAEELQALEEAQEVSPEQREHAEHKAQAGNPEAPKTFASFGEQAMAIAQAAHPGVPRDPRLISDAGPFVGGATGLSEGVASEGGFLVQTDTATELLKRLHETGIIWNRCKNIPISTNANGTVINAIDETSRADGSRWGGIQAYWAAEAAEKTASKPTFRQIKLNLKKLIGLCYATEELLQDAAALEQVLADGFVEEFGFKLDDGVINGLGGGQLLGILNASCLVTVPKEVGQPAKTVVSENIDKMWSRMWPKSQTNAVWFYNQSLQPQLDKMFRAVGAGGIPAYMPPGGLSATPYGTLKGRPAIPIEQCATPGTTGDLILADFSQYVTCTKGGIARASSIHLMFKYDEMTFRWVFRADGQPIWNAALTPYKDATTSEPQSPFVALATR